MRKPPVAIVLMLLFLLLAASGSAFAKDVWMAPTTASPPGNDGNSGLTISTPVATLTRALNIAVAGDTIQMRAGTYPDGVWMSYKAGTPSGYITVRSYDGDYAANFDAALGLQACSYLRFEGIDFSIADGHCVNITGVATAYQVYDKGHHIEFKRCKFHERDTDGTAGGDEVIKCAQSEYYLFEDCEVYVDNGTYTNTSFALDFVWVSYSTIRRMYTHDHNGAAIYTKGGSQYNVLEQSVLAGCRPTSYGASIQTGDGTGLDFANPDCEWETEYYTVRNNVIREGTRCGFFISCVHGLYAYNNLLIDCGDGMQTPYPAIRPYVANWSATDLNAHMNGRAEVVRFFNNLFYDTDGDMGPAFGHLVGSATDWQRGNNNYYNNGNAIPTSTLTVDGVLLDPSTEPGATIGNPGLTNPTGTATTRAGWINLFRPLWNSQSNAMLKDKGSSTAGNAPRPAVLTDIEGNARFRDVTWDIGPYEYQGATPVPSANFAADKTSGSAPLAVQFTDYTAGSPTSWSWNFGDGSTSTAQHPSHTYTSYGSFTVSLTAYNSAGSDAETKANYISVVPLTAAFTSDKTWGEIPLTVQFTDQTDNSPTSWSWNFGDGQTSTTQSPSHTYNSSGYYTVSLTATNANGSDNETKSNYITACSAVVVYPGSYGSQTPTTYYSSGSLSDVQTDNGAYLTFSRQTGGNDLLAWLDADTSYTPDDVFGIGYEVQLKASPANSVNLHISGRNVNNPGWPWSWVNNTLIGGTDQWLTLTTTDMGNSLGTDGTLGVGLCGCRDSSYPSGVFSVNLDVVRFRLYLKPAVGPQPPVANFTGNPTSGTAPLTVAFTDASTNTPTSWSWNFGDSSTSTSQSPSHQYASAGSYTVSLRATNAAGYDDEVKTNYISVSAPPSAPVAAFSGTPTSGTAPLAVSFTDQSTNTPTSWSWNFGDSTTSTSQNPSHSYAAGTYTVSLRATNAAGYDDEVKTNYITASSGGGVVVFYPSSYANMSGTTTVSGTIANLQADDNVYMVHASPSSGNNYRVEHFFATGYTPSQVSRMTIEYRLKSSRDDTPRLSVYGYAPVYGQHTTFLADQYPTTTESTITWTTTNITDYFPADGNVDIDLCGCGLVANTPYQISYDMVKLTLELVGGAPPVAAFSGTPTSGTAPLNVSFTDSSTNTPTSWSWNFGDSSTSTVQNPSHSFAAGTYTVSLRATNASGFDDEVKTNYITATVAPPVAAFSGTPTSGTAPLAVAFTDSSTNTPTSWSWNFGDASTSTSQNPSHSYAVGTYTVSLRATNAGGYDDEVKTNYITATVPPPVAAFSGTPTNGVAPLNVAFTDSSTNTPTSWSWNFGDASTSTSQNPSHSYAVGTYTVSLRATNAGGYDDEVKTNYIAATVPPPVANFTANQTTGAAPLAVSFTDTSTGAPTSWSWNFGDGSTSTSQNPSHTYSSAGYYTVSLRATNAGGYDDEVKTNYLMVCTEVTLFPNAVSQFAWVGQGFTGSLADVRTDNQVYHLTNSSTSTQQDGRRYYFSGSYAAADVARLYVEYEWKGSRSDTPNYMINCLKPGDVPEVLVAQHLHGTTEAWESWYTDTPANYIRADGAVWIDSCGCPVSGNTNNFTTSIDVARVKLWIKPGVTISAPTANFTGTPTSGAPPLTVNFTDSSTGSPTFWAWDFGDGASSTSQSPSHTYAAAGTYTVTLTVNNGYGSNSLVRTNYISVSSATPPTFVAAGTVASSTGAITPALPAGIATNDILLLFLETANQAISISNQNGGTWAAVTNSPQGYGTAAASDATRITVYWSRYNGTQGAPTTSDSGNHQLGRIIAVRGCITSGNPWDVTAGGTESTVDTSGAIPGATTTVANTLVVAGIATSLPDASSTANFSAWANANLTSVTERTDNTVTANNGGGLGIATGVKAAAGAYDNTTVTCGTATTKAMLSVALKP